MEHAVIINGYEDLKYLKSPYSRVYFGNEFCPRLLPDIEELEKILRIAKKNGLDFTFLTSYADSEGLKKIKKLIEHLAVKRMLGEVVVNDFGILHYIQRQFSSAEIVLGRVLSRLSARDGFLKNMGVKRIEADYMTEEFKEAASNGFLKASFYYPYILIQGTRYCPMANLGSNKKENHGIVGCSKNCLRMGDLEFENDLLVKKIILRGNAQFIKNEEGPPKIFEIGSIDRLVFQPK